MVYYELKGELKRIDPACGSVVTTFGSIPIQGNLQEHVEMAGRSAAVQAYFQMIRILYKEGERE